MAGEMCATRKMNEEKKNPEKYLTQKQWERLVEETVKWAVFYNDTKTFKKGQIDAYEDTLRYIPKDYPLHYHIKKKIEKLKEAKK